MEISRRASSPRADLAKTDLRQYLLGSWPVLELCTRGESEAAMLVGLCASSILAVKGECSPRAGVCSWPGSTRRWKQRGVVVAGADEWSLEQSGSPGSTRVRLGEPSPPSSEKAAREVLGSWRCKSLRYSQFEFSDRTRTTPHHLTDLAQQAMGISQKGQVIPKIS